MLVAGQKDVDRQCRPRSNCFCLIRVFPVCYSENYFVNSSPRNQHYICEQKKKCLKFYNIYRNINVLFQIHELEEEKRDLERQVNELKAKCEQIEKRAQEQRQVEEKKHTEEIQFLKRTNQQLKVR